MEDFDEESGDPIWICKHCERTKRYDDDDEDEGKAVLPAM
jgi:hypothetical protein